MFISQRTIITSSQWPPLCISRLTGALDSSQTCYPDRHRGVQLEFLRRQYARNQASRRQTGLARSRLHLDRIRWLETYIAVPPIEGNLSNTAPDSLQTQQIPLMPRISLDVRQTLIRGTLSDTSSRKRLSVLWRASMEIDLGAPRLRRNRHFREP